jgi:cyclase
LFRTKKFKPDYRYTQSQVDIDIADEIFVIDVSPRGSDRKPYYDTLERIAGECFVPIAAGGHVHDWEEAKRLLDLGADKILVGWKHRGAIPELAAHLGSQSLACGIDKGRCDDPVAAAIEAESLGAGEILLQSVERDGSLLGYDAGLIRDVSTAVNIPVVALDGAGSWKHLLDGFEAGAHAVGTQCIYHFTAPSLKKAKEYLVANGIPVRPIS